MVKKFFAPLFFILFILYSKAEAQSQSLQTAFEMPTRVVYDLMIDKKGFLWIASDLGVSKFDGVNLVYFKCADQSSLSAVGLCEDKQGKIWFTNFNGQIFYIENEGVHLLKTYNFKSERGPPKITLLDDKLIATTDDGIFVMNFKTFKGKYFTIGKNSVYSSYSLAKMTSGILIYGKSGFYWYDKNGNFKKLKDGFSNAASATDMLTLNPVTNNDVALIQSNPSGKVIKVFIRKDSVNILQTIKYDSYINSVTIQGGDQWVHTTKVSYLLNSDKEFRNLNISDIVYDKEGNNWISTLGNGVFVKYRKNPFITELKTVGLDRGDLFTFFLNTKKVFYLGTQRGTLILFDPIHRTIIEKKVFDPRLGSINAVAVDSNLSTFVGFSASLVIIKSNGKRIDLPIKDTKQILSVNNYTFVASGSGLIAIPESLTEASVNKFRSLFGNDIEYDTKMGFFRMDKSCHGICFDSLKQSLVLALGKGLFYLNRKGLQPIYYKNKAVYASSICYLQGKLYVGTINDGLLIFDKKGVKQLSVNEGLLSKQIMKIKPIYNHLWIIGSGPLQLFDLTNSNFASYYNLPSRKDVRIIDVNEAEKNAYLMTLNGLLIYPLNKPKHNPSPLDYLLKIEVNNLSVPNISKGSFSYLENNLGFKLEIPNFYYAKDIYIEYSLLNSADTVRKVTEPGGRQIKFSSLPPGDYTFKAVPVNPKSNLNAKVVSYSFQISPPWWKRTWVRFFVVVIVFALVNYIVISYHFRQIAYQRAFSEEQESVRMERQRISSEIHDDIGSGLFAIHLYADRARQKLPNIPEITELSNMVNGIADKIRGIIWSTNAENDNLESLIYYIQYQVEKLFENSSIKFISSIPDDIPDANVRSPARRDIYLIMKELAHNSIKHSEAKQVEMLIEINKEYLDLVMKDNGIGFEKEKPLVNSMGLENIQIRTYRLKGSLTLSESNEGTEVVVQIPLKEMITPKLNDILKKWQLSLFEMLRRSRK